MSCLFPKIGLITPPHADGKRRVKILPSSYDPDKIDVDERRRLIGDGMASVVKIPCGKCVECRLAYSRDWATRLCLEAKSRGSVDCYMITLTYDDDHLPTWQCIEHQKGWPTSYVCVRHPVLKRDVQLFHKRLRLVCNQARFDYSLLNYKYLLSGEYGEKSGRPHYHIVAFGLCLNDLVFVGRSGSGQPLYESQALSAMWRVGLVRVSEFCFDSAAYVARYTLKKAWNNDYLRMKEQGLEPTFMLCSKGLGRSYIESHLDELIAVGSVPILKGDKSVIMPLPRYVYKIAVAHGYDLSDISNERYLSSIITDKKKLSLTSLGEDDYLDQLRDAAEDRQRRLIRPI